MMDFCVTKSSGGLVTPSSPTPSGILNLSRIDSLPVLRCNARTLHVFNNGGSSAAAITKIIRDALSKALVPYYPLAGRLIITTNSTTCSSHQLLQIECSGQGVWFVEASANCTLEQVGYFENVTRIPFHKLLPHDHPPAHPPIDPLVLMQVTEFEGDGFVMGLTFCHSICDGLGAAQFLNAIGEFARGLPTLTIPPVWQRDFLIPPHDQHQNGLSPPLPPPSMPMPPNINYELEQANIDISLDCINQLKTKFRDSQLLTSTSAFEVVAASLWSHRTRAIYHDKKGMISAQVKLVFFANCRELLNPPLPKGFYGNCFFPVTVTTRSETLIDAPLSDVIKLIQEAKARLPLEFGKWINHNNNNNNMNEAAAADDHDHDHHDELQEKGKDDDGGGDPDPFAPPLGYTTMFVSEWGRLGFNQVDYGWGPPRHVVPVQGSSIIPVAIVGWLPYPQKGIRLMTWCVDKAHLQPFLHNIERSGLSTTTTTTTTSSNH